MNAATMSVVGSRLSNTGARIRFPALGCQENLTQVGTVFYTGGQWLAQLGGSMRRRLLF